MRSRTSILLGLATLAGITVSGAQDPVYVDDFSQMSKMSAGSLHESRDLADRYAVASHLAILKDGDTDEVRSWVSWATFDPSTNGVGTVGYVVTNKRQTMCRIAYLAKSAIPRAGFCKRYSPHESPERIVANLTRLSAFADVAISCGVLDGAWVTIDAVSQGKRFVLYANNPQSCRGDGAILVSELLHDVAEPSSYRR